MKRRIKKIADRITAGALMLVLCFNLTAGSYQQVQASSVAAYGAFEVLQGIFSLFGFFVLGNELVNHADDPGWWTDGSAALDPYVNGLYGDLETEYNRERFKVINGGGGGDPQPSPTPEPEATPEPVPTPSPGDIPTFSELVAPAAGAGFIAWTQGAWECMSNAVSNLWDRIMGRVNVSEGIPKECLDIVLKSGCPYYEMQLYFNSNGSLSRGPLVVLPEGSFVVGNIVYPVKGGIYYEYSSSQSKWLHYPNNLEDGYSYISVSSSSYLSSYYANIPKFNTVEEGREWRAKVLKNSFKRENIWVHPDLQDTYQNNGKLEYPQQAPQPLNIPTIEQLQELARKLNPEINPNYTPEMAPNYIQELIEQLKRDPSVNPDPDPGTDPNPNPDVDPKPTGIPKPTPEPDNPDSENSKYLAPDLKDYFPFCIPFDLYDIFNNFTSARAAPKFTFHLKSEKFGFDYPVEIDLSVFDKAAEILRMLELILFVVLLAVASRKLIGAGG